MRKKVLNRKRLRLMTLTLIVLTTIFAVSVTPVSAGGKWFYDFGDVELTHYPGIYWYYEGYFKILRNDEDFYIDNGHVDCYYYTDPDIHGVYVEMHGVSRSILIIDWNEWTITYIGLFFKGVTPDGELITDAGQIVEDFWTGEILELRGHHPLTSGVGGVILDQLPKLLGLV